MSCALPTRISATPENHEKDICCSVVVYPLPHCIIGDSDSDSILNATLNAQINRLYRCQSNILFTIIQGHTFTTYPGCHHGGVRLLYWETAMRSARVARKDVTPTDTSTNPEVFCIGHSMVKCVYSRRLCVSMI